MLLYRAGKTLFLTDLVADKILMIVPMEENQQFLRNMSDLYKAMGIHTKSDGDALTSLSFEKANELMQKVNTFLMNHREGARKLLGVTKKSTNGPEGTVSSATIYPLSSFSRRA